MATQFPYFFWLNFFFGLTFLGKKIPQKESLVMKAENISGGMSYTTKVIL